MGLSTIQVRPGINTQLTVTSNTGGWSSSNLIRFRQGLLEKYAGWEHFSTTPTIGVARGLHAWADLLSNDYLAVGTNERLQLYSAGQIYDITPIRKTSNVSDAFSTTMNTPTVKITDNSHGAAEGDWINVVIYYSVGGLLLQGYYQVASVIDANDYTIIAPANATATVTDGGAVPEFTTIGSSATVTVTLDNHDFAIGNIFDVQVSTTIAGLTLDGSYIVNNVVNANQFTFQVAGSASTSANVFENGGDAQIMYLLPSGNVSDVVLQGYGVGGYGLGAYGGSSGGYYVSPLRNWFLDNFGQNLVAVPSQGALYQWVPPAAFGNVAVQVTQAPSTSNGMFVAMPQEQVMLLGTETGDTQDPMLIAWCDAGNILAWTATATNQAGTYRLSRGSKIMGGLQGPQFGLIWTDLDIWVQNYIAYPLVYGFNIVGEQCGLISPKGANLMNGTAYWMSLKGFFEYNPSNGVLPIPCTIWDWIFDRLDTNNLDKIFTAPNSLFNEMAFFFPSTDSTNPTAGEIDSYGKLNIAEGLWDYGLLTRFSWIDQSILGTPIGVDGNNLIQQHEMGYDADGVAMEDVFAQTGYVEISDGTVFIFVDWLIPDFLWKTIQPTTQPRVNITVYTLYYPGDVNPATYGPFTITPQTPYISFRARARYMAIRFECDTLDTFFRIGSVKYRSAPAGRY